MREIAIVIVVLCLPVVLYHAGRGLIRVARQLTAFVAVAGLSAGGSAADFSPVANGPWDAQSTWNRPGIPGPNDNVTITGGQVVTLAGDTTVSAVRIFGGGGTIDGAGHAFAAQFADYLVENARLVNTSATATYRYEGYEQPLTIRPQDRFDFLNPYSMPITVLPGSRVEQIVLYGGARDDPGEPPTIVRVKAGATGLTAGPSSLAFVNYEYHGEGSHVVFEIDGNQPGWALRWANPVYGGNQLAQIATNADSGLFRFEVSNGGGYTFVDGGDGNTYIYSSAPVPEPKWLWTPSLLCIACWLGVRSGTRSQCGSTWRRGTPENTRG